jgi:integrase/recombinase XerD
MDAECSAFHLAKELPMTILRQRMIEDMQVQNLSSSTRDTYLLQVSLFARHFRKSPAVLGPEELRSYQAYLINEKKLAPSSIQIAVTALRSLYKVTLKRQWSFEEVLPAPKIRTGYRASSAGMRFGIFSRVSRASSIVRS